MTDRVFAIKINADGTVAVNTFNQVGAAGKRMEKDISGATGGIKASLVNLAAAWYTIEKVIGLVEKAWHFAEMAADFEEQKRSLNNFAATYQTTADAIIEKVQELTRGQISLMNITRISSKALALDVPLDKYEELAKYADALGDAIGVHTTEALEMMTEAAEKGTAKFMKQIAGVIDLDAHFGKLTESMTEHEKIQKRVEIMLDILRNKYGNVADAVDSNADKMERLKATGENLQLLLGQGLIRAAAGIAGTFQAIASAALYLTAGIVGLITAGAHLTDKFGITKGAAQSWQIQKDALNLASSDLWNKAKSNIELMTSSSKDLQKAMAPLPSTGEKNQKWLDAMAEAAKRAADVVERFKESIAKSNPDLDEMQQKLLELQNSSSQAIREIEKIDSNKMSKSVKESYIDQIRQATDEGAEYIRTEGAQKMAQAHAELQEEIYKLTSTEQAKEFAENDKWLVQKLDQYKNYEELKATAIEGWEIKTSQIRRKYAVQDMQYELDLQEIESQALLNEKTDLYDSQKAAYDDLHSHLLISDEEYIDKMIELSEKDTAARLEFIDKQFETFINERSKELAMESTTKEEMKKIYEEITKYAASYYANRTKIATAGQENIKAIERQMPKSFGEGADEGVREYLKSLEYNFDKGKSMALDFAHNVEDALVKMFDNPKKAIKDLFNYFLNYLKRMVVQALANPIIIPITTAMTGTANTLQGGMAGLTSGGGLLGGIGSLLGYGGLGAGIGSLTGGSTLGGGIGGLLGAWLLTGAGTTGMGLIGAGLTSGLFGLSGGALGASLGSIVPIIGTIIGGLLGSLLGGLFGGGKPDVGELGATVGLNTTPTGIVQTGEWKHYMTPGGYGIGVNMSDQGWPMTDAQLKQLADAFDKVGNSVKDVMEKLGLDVSGFAKTWSEHIDLAGLSAEDAQKKIKQWMADYIQFASGIDFSQWQKSGEDIIQTIDRIITALNAIPAMKESIQDTIFAIKNSLDISSLVKEQMQKYDQNITDLWDKLSEMTDPADQISQLDQIRQAVILRYQDEMKMVTDLQNAIASLKTEAQNFALTMQGKIDALTGASKSTGMMWDRMTDIYNQISGISPIPISSKYQTGAPILPASTANRPEYHFVPTSSAETLTAAEKLAKLQEYIQLLDQWVADNITAIQQQYELQKQAIQENIDNINTQIEALNVQKQAINDQISALQDQVNLSKQWKSIIDSVEKQLLDMKTSLSSPQDIFERMDVMKAEMERVRGLYAGATGDEKAGYASQLQSLISEYLGMAQEAYQRPSPEYQAIYSEMLGWLEGIKTDAGAQAVSQEDLLAQISSLQAQSKAIDEQIAADQSQIKDLNAQMAGLDTQMAADIQAFKDSAVQYYQWAMAEGATLYQDKLTELESQLQAIVGNGTVEQFIAQLKDETIAELQNIENTLDSILAVFANIPQSAGGNYFSRPSLTWIAEREPEYAVPASKMGSNGGQTVVSIGDIHVHAAPGMNENSLAEAVVKKVEGSIRHGRLGEAVKKRVKNG